MEYIITYGPITIDITIQSAQLNNQQIHLTPIELRILCYFIKHNNKTISDKELVESIWNSRGIVVRCGLGATYIKNIRKKLPGIIKTVCGEGYRLDLSEQMQGESRARHYTKEFYS